MKSSIPAVVCSLLILTATASVRALSAARVSDSPAPAPAENRYIGADKCKSCHGTAGGDMYGKWKETKHAHAFETLSSEASAKLATEKGIADAAKSDECVKCHVTAFGAAESAIKPGFVREHGVQCETCHGPGEQHVKARFAAAAKPDAPTGYVQVPPDEIVAVPTMAVCVECHNEKSPSYKPFCFHEFNAQIRHLNPKKPRTAVEIGACTCPKCAQGCPESCKELTKVK